MQPGMIEAVGVKAAEWSIGVDFGTAFSKAAAMRIDAGAGVRQVRALRIGDAAGWRRPFLTPSSMFLDRKRVHFGPRALEQVAGAPSETRELVLSFKTILGANDFEGALDFYPRAAIDPDRAFRLRDLISLYLAYLLALVDVAAAGAFNRSGGMLPSSRLRFTRPGWIPERIAAAHETMTSLFNKAHLVYLTLGDELLAPGGLDYAAARAALDGARADPTAFANLDGGIYEASAVAMCHYNEPGAPTCLLIADIGGGTTDCAGLIRAPAGEGVRVIRAARRTIDVAGDEFDAALLDLIVAKARRLKTVADRSALWRSLAPNVRELKEELFANGAVKIQFRKLAIRCTARELERHPAFKAALADIKQLYEACLAEIIRTVDSKSTRRIGVVLAGGGSHLPAIRSMIAKKRWIGWGRRIVHLPATPAWAADLGGAQEFEAVFAQLSAAFGAALSTQTLALEEAAG